MSSHPLSPPAPAIARGAKTTALGLLSIAPAATMAIAVVSWLLAIMRFEQAVTSFDAAPAEPRFGLMAAVLVVSAVASLAAFVVFLADVMTNRTVAPDRRLVWALLLLFANVVAFPVYWYVVWWRPSCRTGSG
jgi:hypothetical protein